MLADQTSAFECFNYLVLQFANCARSSVIELRKMFSIKRSLLYCSNLNTNSTYFMAVIIGGGPA